jgi:TIR domain/Protein kinase domain
MSWDIFISHASEDKNEVARPLAQLLQAAGLSVWLDEHELVLGDSLRKKLDEGLSQSRWGIVILSQDFLRKIWTQAELDALISREENGLKVILPVWHRVSREELLRKSPLLAARLGISTSEGIEAVCKAVLRAVGSRKASNGQEILKTDDPHEFLDTWFSADQLRTTTPRNQVVGQQVGRYLLKEFVGMGGTGKVFHAIHLPVGTSVALKVFYPVKEQFLPLTRATERAVRGLTALRHRGIATLLDFGYFSRRDAVTAYLACEFVRGKSLDQWSRDIAAENEAPMRRLRAAIEIAEILRSAHTCKYVGDLGLEETGVLHGDLKPENIIVRLSDDQPKIVDFMEPDLQRVLLDPDRSYTYWKKRENGSYWYDGPLTEAYGTPGYMPPEQAIDGIVSPASDVYALGITFIRLFYPFWFRDESQLPVNDSLADEKFRITPLIDRMVMAQPHERIQSMDVVVTELRRIQDEMRIGAFGRLSRLVGKLSWRRSVIK